MGNYNKWNRDEVDNNIETPINVVLFVSRNKDNKDIENFKERRNAFVTTRTHTDLHTRATNLKLKTGAIYPGLTLSAVYWLSDAYLKQAPVNKQAFQNTVTRLSQINKPTRY